MSKRQQRKDLITLAEWCETFSRHHLELALDGARKPQQIRSLRFKAKRLAQIATVLRQFDAQLVISGQAPVMHLSADDLWDLTHPRLPT